MKCGNCNMNHPTCLHWDKPQQPQQAKARNGPQQVKKVGQNQEGQNGSSRTSVNIISTTKVALLKSFETMANENGTPGMIRSLMDDGAQNTWITEKSRQNLKLPIKNYATLQVGVAFGGGYAPPEEFPIVEVDLTTETGEIFTMDALVRTSPICAR